MGQIEFFYIILYIGLSNNVANRVYEVSDL